MKNTTRGAILLLTLLGAACAGKPPAAPGVEPEYAQKPANPVEEAFAREPGVRPIRWGGWIKTVIPGTGTQANADNVVKVHYRGALTDGTEFDSSYQRGEPAVFSLRNVIPCWMNGVAEMKTGEKAKLLCPSSAAYGEKGAPPSIPGGATLAFEIELLEIVK